MINIYDNIKRWILHSCWILSTCARVCAPKKGRNDALIVSRFG